MRTVRPLFFVLWVLGGTAWAEQAAEEAQQCKARVQDARVAPDLAVQDCGRALQANQLSQVDRVDVLFYRAVAYERAGEHGRAIQDYSEVIRLKPTLAAAFVSRGLAYAATKEYGRAIADYNQDLRLRPNEATFFVARGLAHKDAGQIEDAIRDFDQALRLDPSDALVFFARGNAYGYLGEDDRAIEDYNQALALNPNLASAFANRGDAFAHQGDHVRAIQDYNAALQLRPNDARLVRLRGRVQFNHGDFQAAVPDFAAAAALEPHRYDHLLFLYLAQVRAGQDGRAELARQAEHQSLGAWPGPVVSLYLGQLTPDAVLLEAVASTPVAKVQRERQCQAYYYVGQHFVTQGRQQEAVEMFRAALATGSSRLDEYGGAQAELQRLGIRAAWTASRDVATALSPPVF